LMPKAPRSEMQPSVSTVIALLIATLHSCRGSVPLESCLRPSTEVFQQFVSFEVPVSYCVRDLAPESTYELKVSYPGTQPTLFKMSLYEDEPAASRPPGHGSAALDNSDEGATTGARGRRLLDTEKVVFSTDPSGSVVLLGRSVPASRVFLRIEAAPASPDRLLAGRPPRSGTQVRARAAAALDASMSQPLRPNNAAVQLEA
jgi:hypothetical protein